MEPVLAVAEGTRPGIGAGSLWLRDRRWDLTFITLSVATAGFPLLLHHAFGVSPDWVGYVVLILVGAPHVYTTYTRTWLEPRFVRRYTAFFLGGFLVPAAVITLALKAPMYFTTGFFFWASVHILHQITYIVMAYQKKHPRPLPLASRLIDYGVVFTSLYPIATWKMVHGKFDISGFEPILPSFILHDWFWIASATAFGLCLVLFIGKTVSEWQEGRFHAPKTALIAVTVALAFSMPAFPNLDVSFQAFNTWHSFQYLALTWYINRLRQERGEISREWVRRTALPGRHWHFYGVALGATFLLVAAIFALQRLSGLPPLTCYYVLGMSFLLLHYYFDHFLFTRTADLVPA